MKSTLKYLLLLVSLYVIILIAAFIFTSVAKQNLYFGDIAISAAVFSIIAFITLIIFFKGRSKEPDSQTLYILVAISLKFLLDISFALVWFIVVKKTYLSSVIMFFVLYLTLTLFSVLVILKALRNKAL